MVQNRNPAERGGASGNSVHAAKLNIPEDTQVTAANQVLTACLIREHTCSAAGIKVTAHNPVVELCRRLVDAGHDPATTMDVYRDETLVTTVRGIGEAVPLEISSTTRQEDFKASGKASGQQDDALGDMQSRVTDITQPDLLRKITVTDPSALRCHPLADDFPALEGADFDLLVADIKANGLTNPIIVYEQQILDGRNRHLACEKAEVAPTFMEYCGNDPAAFVISVNIHRRHLKPTQKRALIAKLLKVKPNVSDRQIAATAMSDHKTVGAVRAQLEGRGEIPHTETRIDAAGRMQPAPKIKGAEPVPDTRANATSGGARPAHGSRKQWLEEPALEQAEAARLGEALVQSDPELAKRLHDILRTGDRHVHAFLDALRRGLGIVDDSEQRAEPENGCSL